MNSAMRLFGLHGYEQASTRDIAADASLNTPALQYYFNNKEGLYVACAERVVAAGWMAMQDVVMEAEGLLAQRAGDESLIEAFCRLQERLADVLNDASGDWLLWLAREQSRPDATPGYLLKHRKVRRMQDAGRDVVSRLMGRPCGDPESLLHELSLNGHLMRFHLMRQSALKSLRWRSIDEVRLALIKRVARQHSVAALRALVAQCGAPAKRRRR